MKIELQYVFLGYYHLKGLIDLKEVIRHIGDHESKKRVHLGYNIYLSSNNNLCKNNKTFFISTKHRTKMFYKLKSDNFILSNNLTIKDKNIYDLSGKFGKDSNNLFYEKITWNGFGL